MRKYLITLFAFFVGIYIGLNQFSTNASNNLGIVPCGEGTDVWRMTPMNDSLNKRFYVTFAVFKWTPQTTNEANQFCFPANEKTHWQFSPIQLTGDGKMYLMYARPTSVVTNYPAPYLQ